MFNIGLIHLLQGGKGLHSTLNFHAKKFIGILNGIDTDVWNPATDTLLEVQYNANDLQGKAENKIATRQHLGLSTADARQPLVSFLKKIQISCFHIFRELLCLNAYFYGV